MALVVTSVEITCDGRPVCNSRITIAISTVSVEAAALTWGWLLRPGLDLCPQCRTQPVQEVR